MHSVFSRQERASYTFDPDARPFLATLVVHSLISVLSVSVCGLAFSILPASNPLRDGHGSHWWHCALPCAVVWSPLSVAYIRELLQEFVYTPLRKSLGLGEAFAIYAAFASAMVFVMFILMGVWANPAPLNGVIATLAALTGAAAMINFVLLPWLIRDCMGDSERSHQDKVLSEVRRTATLVVAFSVLSAVVLMAVLIWCSFLSWLDVWYAPAAGIILFRVLFSALFELMTSRFGSQAQILGINLVLISAGMANVITLGSSGTWKYTVTLIALDILNIGRWVVSLASWEPLGLPVSHILLDPLQFLWSRWKQGALSAVPRLGDEALMEAERSQLSYLLAAELAEVSVPLAYCLCWSVTWAGPNSGSFSGTGTSDFGLTPPEDPLLFAAMTTTLVVANQVSLELLKFLLNRWCGVRLDREAAKLFQMYGRLLVVQTVWIVVTAFCMTMIQCGLDYSLRYAYLAGVGQRETPR